MIKKALQGKWEIIDSEVWDKEALDLTETAYIKFDGEFGKFHFICVDGFIDVEYHGNKAEFSWLGNDENDMVCGRGWAIIDGDKMTGKIYFHQGEKSSFSAQKI